MAVRLCALCMAAATAATRGGGARFDERAFAPSLSHAHFPTPNMPSPLPLPHLATHTPQTHTHTQKTQHEHYSILVNFLLPPPLILALLLVLPFPRSVRKGILLVTNKALSFTVGAFLLVFVVFCWRRLRGPRIPQPP